MTTERHIIESPPPDSNVGAAKRILMCDDDIFIIRAAEYKLRNAGYEVKVAHDGEEAWGFLANGETFDLLISDRQMPRVDGLELIRRIRACDDALLQRMPIVLLTSRAHDLQDCDANVIIDKPFSPRNLVRQVHDLCEMLASSN